MKKKLITSLLTATVLSTSLMRVTPVSADEFELQIEEAQATALQNESAATKLEVLIKQLTSDMKNTESALNSLNSEIEENETLLAEAIKSLETANQEMNQLLEEIEKLEENIERREDKLEEQARTIQVNGRSVNYFEYILEAESLTDILARVDVVTNIIRSNNQMMEEQISDKEQVTQKSEETEQKIAQQNAIAGELEQMSANLESQKASQEALVLQLELERHTASEDREKLLTERNEALLRASSIQSDRDIARAAAEEAAEEQAQEIANQTPTVNDTNITEVEQMVPATSNRESSTAEAVPTNQTTQQTQSEPSRQAGTNTSRSENTQTPVPSVPAPAPKPTPAPAPKPTPKPAVPSGDVLSVARGWLGTPYLYGGNSRGGIDCSAFVQQVFAAAGKSISRTTWSQYAGAQKIGNPSPGDLVFFSNGNNGNIDHVGIYVGSGQFIGSQTSTGVAYASTTSGYWSTRIVGYGRY